ncbi:rab GTPase-activating protein 1-like [Seriola aureovittata]|uniref:rab GTPase-activating protein 1-like n=1 Tax=Seriola aureovittata TaxID=2871759 RepID=UPI0024BD9783|nr:rab GTPase-activating protein 1-like [Seriola aureovittata]
MMEEVSVMMAYDAQVMEQMSEEEILACLVDETGPKFTVPTKKVKLRESRLQIMDDEEEEDPLDKYLKENRQLQQASLRLEQENDNLAHRLISSKVALRNALDKTEDRVDELTKDLLQTRHRLQATEEEKRGMEEEAAMLKEVFRRELEKAEQEVRRSSGIVADYKQICSQLTNRLERQQAAHKDELDSLKSAVKACARCRHLVERHEPPTAGETSQTAALTEGQGLTEAGQDEDDEGPEKAEQRREDQEKESIKVQIRELEQELVQTKLQMVEAKCKIQELEHQRGLLTNDLQEAKNSWISKAFTSLRTSSGGLHGIGMPKDGAPALGWNLHSGSLSGWSSKKLSWPHRDNRTARTLDADHLKLDTLD